MKRTVLFCAAMTALLWPAGRSGSAAIRWGTAADSTQHPDSSLDRPATGKLKKQEPQAKKNGDKVIGEDEKGRTIYEGPRAGGTTSPSLGAKCTSGRRRSEPIHARNQP